MGDASGKVSLIDHSGTIVAAVYPGGIPTAIVGVDDQLIVGNDQGEVIAYKLP